MARSLSALFLLLVCSASLATAQFKPDRIRISEDAMQGLLIKKVDPQLPADVHVQGVVALRVRIDKAGNVENLEMISGHPMLVAAAIDAVKQWKYKPFTLNGQAFKVETTIHVRFQSKESSGQKKGGNKN